MPYSFLVLLSQILVIITAGISYWKNPNIEIKRKLFLPLALQSFMDLDLLDDPPSDIPIMCFLPPCLYFQ
jgi:hypothetical protein